MNPTPKTESAGPHTPDAPKPDAAEATPAEDSAAPAATQVNDPQAAGAETVVEDSAPTGDLASRDDDLDIDDEEDEGDEAAAARTPSGLGTASAAVVAVALGIVALTGTWTSQVAAARENVIGQLHTVQTDTSAQQIKALFGEGWHVTALINGGVALLALIIAVVVLVLPTHASWVRPVAVAGVVLAAIGLLVAIGMYFDLFASLPTAPPAPPAPAPPAPVG
jgi:hypothetical protein